MCPFRLVSADVRGGGRLRDEPKECLRRRLHLPRPVMKEGMAATVTDPQILNFVAQSNLLIMQLLAKNAQL